MNIEITANARRNLAIVVSGALDAELQLTNLLDGVTIEFERPEHSMKLTDAVWVIQEKMGFALFWDKEENYPIMPMESRNSLRLDTGWKSPKEWTEGLWIKSFGFETGPKPKHFVFNLGFDK